VIATAVEAVMQRREKALDRKGRLLAQNFLGMRRRGCFVAHLRVGASMPSPVVLMTGAGKGRCRARSCRVYDAQ
jgi:hypothetical protein